jgi:serine/threonine protein kinase
MTPERYQLIGQLFNEALELAAGARVAFLEQACGGDSQLLDEVEKLLAYDSDSEDFLSRPAMQVAAALFAQNQASNTVGKQIRHYEILSLLGVGGMGQVYLARDTRLERNVALKLLPAQFTGDAERVRRFEQEARAASALNHPNILTIFDIGQPTDETDSLHFIATEYIEGQTLRQLLQGRPLAPKQVIEIAIQLADALSVAHAVGIVHRDIKPENVMRRTDGYVKVLDFGLAKLTEQRQASLLTDPGRVMGTISYMSPEQALGQTVDHRSDIFSLGVVLYELLSGVQPFKGDSEAATYNAILNLTPAPVTNSQPDLPNEWQWIIEHMLEKRPEQRFQTAADLKAALQTLKHESDAGAMNSASGANPQTLRQPGQRSWVTKAAIAAAASVVLAVAGVVGWFGSNPAPTPTLKPANFTQITRKPGQEIYPSLSPDGKLLVYSDAETGNWDIYLQRVSGTTPINLTRDSAANDTQPAFSPDGEQIVFRSDRDGGGIFVMGATGENVRRLIDYGHNPAWSPDGQEIAFSNGSFARRHLQLLFDSNRYERLTEFGESPIWLNDNHRLLFFSQDNLFLLDSRTRKAKEILTVAPTHFQSLGISRDSRVIYFSLQTTEADIWLATLEAEP